VEHLFGLQKIAFVVEIALAKARKNDSEVQIQNKSGQCPNKQKTPAKILEQAQGALKSTEYFEEKTAEQDHDYIMNYFMGTKDDVDLHIP
jgi:hypothetical protein